MPDIRNSFTPPWHAWGGNPPTSFLSGSGLVFYGMNAKDVAGAMFYLVWSIDLAGTVLERLKLGPNAGQGALCVDQGWLVLTYFVQTGDGQRAERIAVPGWVRAYPYAEDDHAAVVWAQKVRAVE